MLGGAAVSTYAHTVHALRLVVAGGVRPGSPFLYTVPATGDMIAISVADTGHGIAPEVAGQLFQPFVTTKRHGMGVGLSISRTIVEGHGGRIEVEPNPGGGTIFRITLHAADTKDFGDAA